MQVEALSIFCDVVRFQSFSRGALANSVSQSAASQTIRQIEKQLGTQLIDRSKRPWQLTSEGQTFFKGCQEIVERYHELEEAVQRGQGPTAYTIRLASIYSIRRPDSVTPKSTYRFISTSNALSRLERIRPLIIR